MIELRELTCEVCRKGAPQVTLEEIEGYMPQVPDWQVVEVDGEQETTKKGIT